MDTVRMRLAQAGMLARACVAAMGLFAVEWRAVQDAQEVPMALEPRCVTTTAWVPRGYTLVARRPVTVCAEAP